MTYEETANIAEHLLNADIIGIDYETDGLDFKTASIHGIALAVGSNAWYVTGVAQDMLLPVLQRRAKDALFVGHNLGFDFHFMWRQGIRPVHYADTMMAQFLVDENQELGLKNLAYSKLGYDRLPDFKALMTAAKKAHGKKRLADVSINDIDQDELAAYAARDAKLTLELWDKSQYELSREGMTELFWNTEMPFIKVLADMEEVGFIVDQPLLAQLDSGFRQRRDDALGTFDKITGGINPGSPAQLSKWFYTTLGMEPTVFTEKGAPSVDALALSRLIPLDSTGSAKALAEYRQFSKLVSTYIDSYRERMVNGMLYGHFNQLGDSDSESGRLPRTGRLSSSNPNLQNIPARGDIGSRVRELFIAGPGETVVDIDYSQLEMRIAAHYTKDENLLGVFTTGGDPHQLTADLCGVPRYIAKTLNFGCVPMYSTALTPTGWKGYKELHIGDDVMALDPETGTMVWTPIIDLACYEDAPLVQMARTNGGMSIVTTPNHRWLTSNKTFVYAENILLNTGLVLAGSADNKPTLHILPEEAGVLALLHVYGDGATKVFGNTHSVDQFIVDTLNVGKYVNVTTGANGKPVYTIAGSYSDYLHSRIDFGPKADVSRLEKVVSMMSRKQLDAFLNVVFRLSSYANGQSVKRIPAKAPYIRSAITLAATLSGYYVDTLAFDDVLVLRKGTVGRVVVTKLEGTAKVWCLKTKYGTWVMRQGGQVVVTGNTLYGQGPRKFADVVERTGKPRPSLQEAKDYLAKFAVAYPSITNWKQRVVEYARQLGYVRTIGGRKRRLPDINERDNSLRGKAERQAANTIIQGSAADIIKHAMLSVYPYQEQYGARLQLQCHDELVWRVPQDAADEFGQLASRLMTDAGEHFKLRAPLEAEPGYGQSWGAAKH